MLITPINKISLSDKNYINYDNNNNSSNAKFSQPSFSGNPFSFLTSKKAADAVKATLFSDPAIYSPKQLKKLKYAVAMEVKELINMPYTEARAERMNKILRSPFFDYEKPYFGTASYTDQIFYNFGGSANKSDMYKEFVLTSLSETMPLELMRDERKTSLFAKDSTVKEILNSYINHDENSDRAKRIRQMILRLKEAEVPIPNTEYLLADNILNNQAEMCKLLVKNFDLNPDDTVYVIQSSNAYNDTPWGRYSLLKENFNLPYEYDDRVTKGSFFILNPDAYSHVDYEKRFGLDECKTQMSLYDLTGLSLDKSIREDLFNIPDFIKKKPDKIVKNMNRAVRRENPVLNFLDRAEKYHPEIKNLDFFEKCIELHSIDTPMSTVFGRFQRSYFMSPELLENTLAKIKRLKSENNPQNIYFINRLSDFYIYVGNIQGVPRNTLSQNLL